MIDMNKIGNYIKEERKKAGLTQEEFAMRSGLGLRFVRELEQGKETVRMDKVNQALAMSRRHSQADGTYVGECGGFVERGWLYV